MKKINKLLLSIFICCVISCQNKHGTSSAINKYSDQMLDKEAERLYLRIASGNYSHETIDSMETISNEFKVRNYISQGSYFVFLFYGIFNKYDDRIELSKELYKANADPMYLMAIGCSYDKLGYQDSANYYYCECQKVVDLKLMQDSLSLEDHINNILLACLKEEGKEEVQRRFNSFKIVYESSIGYNAYLEVLRSSTLQFNPECLEDIN